MSRSFLRLSLPILTFVVASCAPEDPVLTHRLADHLGEIEAANHELEAELAAQRRILTAMSMEKERLVAGRGRLEKELAGARDELGRITKESSDYKAAYRRGMQARAKGMKLPDMEIDGRKYIGLVVNSASSSDLVVLHEGGTTRFPFEDLPISIQNLFGYDPAAAESAAPAVAAMTPLHMEATEKSLSEGRALVDETKRKLEEQKREKLEELKRKKKRRTVR